MSAKKPSKKKKHQATSDEKELKRAAKRLGTELERSDARVEHWKQKAGRAEKKVAEIHSAECEQFQGEVSRLCSVGGDGEVERLYADFA